MNVSIIAVGTELLKGRDNADLVYLSKKLSEFGYIIQKALTVRDNLNEITSAFKDCLKTSSIVIATGGLGPTFDDLTRQALAKAIGKKLYFDDKLFKIIEKYFVCHRVNCPPENKNQAYRFKGSCVLHNPRGTAPGLWVNGGGSKVAILLPGPPNELIPMFEKEVLPKLHKHFKPLPWLEKNFYICGLGESEVNHRITPLIQQQFPKGVSVDWTILANLALVELRLNVYGKRCNIMKNICARVACDMRRLFGNYIFSESHSDLAKVVGDMLLKRKKTIAVAESCTGGLICDRLTNIPGSSRYVSGGVVTYSNEQKIKLLGVKRSTLRRFGAVSSETVYEMLDGVKKLFRADYALAVSGIAGPGGGTKRKPVGLVYIGVATPGKCEVVKHHFRGDRLRIKNITANKALNALRLII